MPVILLGALGGMVSGGIVGMFVGAVLLAVGYQLFMTWWPTVPTPRMPTPTGRRKRHRTRKGTRGAWHLSTRLAALAVAGLLAACTPWGRITRSRR